MYSVFLLSVIPLEFRNDLCFRNLCTSCTIVWHCCLTVCLAVLLKHRIVLDRLTDRQTDIQADTAQLHLPR